MFCSRNSTPSQLSDKDLERSFQDIQDSHPGLELGIPRRVLRGALKGARTEETNNQQVDSENDTSKKEKIINSNTEEKAQADQSFVYTADFLSQQKKRTSPTKTKGQSTSSSTSTPLVDWDVIREVSHTLLGQPPEADDTDEMGVGGRFHMLTLDDHASSLPNLQSDADAEKKGGHVPVSRRKNRHSAPPGQVFFPKPIKVTRAPENHHHGESVRSPSPERVQNMIARARLGGRSPLTRARSQSPTSPLENGNNSGNRSPGAKKRENRNSGRKESRSPRPLHNEIPGSPPPHPSSRATSVLTRSDVPPVVHHTGPRPSSSGGKLTSSNNRLSNESATSLHSGTDTLLSAPDPYRMKPRGGRGHNRSHSWSHTHKSKQRSSLTVTLGFVQSVLVSYMDYYSIDLVTADELPEDMLHVLTTEGCPMCLGRGILHVDDDDDMDAVSINSGASQQSEGSGAARTQESTAVAADPSAGGKGDTPSTERKSAPPSTAGKPPISPKTANSKGSSNSKQQQQHLTNDDLRAVVTLTCKALCCSHVMHVPCLATVMASQGPSAPMLERYHNSEDFRAVTFTSKTGANIFHIARDPLGVRQFCTMEVTIGHMISNAQILSFVWPHTISSLVDEKSGNEYLLLKLNNTRRKGNSSSSGELPSHSFRFPVGKLMFKCTNRSTLDMWEHDTNFDLSIVESQSDVNSVRLVRVDPISLNTLTIGLTIHRSKRPTLSPSHAGGLELGSAIPLSDTIVTYALSFIKYEFCDSRLPSNSLVEAVKPELSGSHSIASMMSTSGGAKPPRSRSSNNYNLLAIPGGTSESYGYSPRYSPYQSPYESPMYSPMYSPYHSPYQSPYYSPYHSPYHSPNASPLPPPEADLTPRSQHSPKLSPQSQMSSAGDGKSEAGESKKEVSPQIARSRSGTSLATDCSEDPVEETSEIDEEDGEGDDEEGEDRFETIHESVSEQKLGDMSEKHRDSAPPYQSSRSSNDRHTAPAAHKEVRISTSAPRTVDTKTGPKNPPLPHPAALAIREDKTGSSSSLSVSSNSSRSLLGDLAAPGADEVRGASKDEELFEPYGLNVPDQPHVIITPPQSPRRGSIGDNPLLLSPTSLARNKYAAAPIIVPPISHSKFRKRSPSLEPIEVHVSNSSDEHHDRYAGGANRAPTMDQPTLGGHYVQHHQMGSLQYDHDDLSIGGPPNLSHGQIHPHQGVSPDYHVSQQAYGYSGPLPPGHGGPQHNMNSRLGGQHPQGMVDQYGQPVQGGRGGHPHVLSPMHGMAPHQNGPPGMSQGNAGPYYQQQQMGHIPPPGYPHLAPQQQHRHMHGGPQHQQGYNDGGHSQHYGAPRHYAQDNNSHMPPRHPPSSGRFPHDTHQGPPGRGPNSSGGPNTKGKRSGSRHNSVPGSSSSNNNNNDRSQRNGGGRRGDSHHTPNNNRSDQQQQFGGPRGSSTGNVATTAATSHPVPIPSSVAEARGQIERLCRSHDGSRFIQERLEARVEEEVEIMFTEMLPHIGNLMMDSFGHFAAEKLVRKCSHTQLLRLIEALAPDMSVVACQKHGSFSIQALLDSITTREQVDAFVHAITPGIVPVILHSSGHFVVLKFLQNFKENSAFILQALEENIVEVGTDHHGLRVVKAVLSQFDARALSAIFKEVTRTTTRLVENQYGNYVIQSVLDVAPKSVSTNMKVKMEGKYLRLSKQKFSSNVVERTLRDSSALWRGIIINELTAQPAVGEVLRDRYGNYCLQTALTVADDAQVEVLINGITPHLTSLRDNVRQKWEMLLHQARERVRLSKQ